ncbi:MAG: hypothetical protein IJS07_08455 [Bacteroidales bacterium]|nr:hypothetical protein [Bacteroidales bacterium]
MNGSDEYKDIIDLPYPRPSTRRRMTLADRAAQFSAFAALTGFDGVVNSEEQAHIAAVDAERYFEED